MSRHSHASHVLENEGKESRFVAAHVIDYRSLLLDYRTLSCYRICRGTSTSQTGPQTADLQRETPRTSLTAECVIEDGNESQMEKQKVEYQMSAVL